MKPYKAPWLRARYWGTGEGFQGLIGPLRGLSGGYFEAPGPRFLQNGGLRDETAAEKATRWLRAV
jgi:hypothetical protein